MDKVAGSPLADGNIAVGVFIKAGAVVFCKGIAVHGKMHGNEIHDNADIVLVALVDELHKLGGSTVA